MGQAGRAIRRIAGMAAAAACGPLAFAGGAGAGTQQVSGTMPSGGCSPVYPVEVAGASRIEVAAVVDDGDVQYEPLIVDAAGDGVSRTGIYDTAAGGVYGVKICTPGGPADPPTLQYTAWIGTGPAGRPALPPDTVGIAGAFTTFRPAQKIVRSARVRNDRPDLWTRYRGPLRNRVVELKQAPARSRACSPARACRS
jgi:hypothetical protein